MAISSLSSANPLTALTRTPTVGATGDTAATGGTAPGFGDALKDLLQAMDGATGEANEKVSQMMGGTGDVHEAMIALQRAEVTMQLTVQIRNKLVAAYHDVMRMPI